MAAACTLGAYTGRAYPSLHLPPLHPHTAGAAKLVFRPILSPAEGTKHGESLNSFELQFAHISREQQLSYSLG